MSSAVRRLRYDHEKGKVVEVTPERPSVAAAPVSIGPTSSRPLASTSAGVLPHQVPEARRIVEERGLVGCEVQDDGQVNFTCRGNTGRNGWNRMRGMTDHDGGFGDV